MNFELKALSLVQASAEKCDALVVLRLPYKDSTVPSNVNSIVR